MLNICKRESSIDVIKFLFYCILFSPSLFGLILSENLAHRARINDDCHFFSSWYFLAALCDPHPCPLLQKYHLSFRFFTVMNVFACSPTTAWIFLQTFLLVTWSLYYIFSNMRKRSGKTLRVGQIKSSFPGMGSFIYPN